MVAALLRGTWCAGWRGQVTAGGAVDLWASAAEREGYWAGHRALVDASWRCLACPVVRRADCAAAQASCLHSLPDPLTRLESDAPYFYVVLLLT